MKKQMRTEPPSGPDLFKIWVDFDARLFYFKFIGLWEKEMYDRSTEAAIREMRKFKNAGLAFDGLGDLTEFPVQHQYLNEARQKLSIIARQMGLRKCAVVVKSVLVKQQIDRLTQSYQFFTSEQEALAWLRQ
jgi:hypothetical protein